MHHNFEYAVIRVVPQVEREEFINVGVVLYCQKHKFLQMLFHIPTPRLLTLFPLANAAEIETHLSAFQKIAFGDSEGGPIACLDMATRFRWLTARRSTIVQPSAVHPGLCTNPVTTLQKLFETLVLL